MRLAVRDNLDVHDYPMIASKRTSIKYKTYTIGYMHGYTMAHKVVKSDSGSVPSLDPSLQGGTSA